MLLDVGLANTGVAIYDLISKEFLHLECYSTEKGEGRVSLDNVFRCRSLFLRLNDLAQRYNVEVVAAELPHGGAKSSRAASAMAMSLSVTACFVASAQLKFFPVTPLEVKRLISNAAVSKEQVQDYVDSKFGKILPKGRRREHIADAIMCLEVYTQRHNK